jgi:hypothetical protein
MYRLSDAGAVGYLDRTTTGLERVRKDLPDVPALRQALWGR